MDYISALQSDILPGFDFSYYNRNNILSNQNNGKPLKYTSTGTTICGLVCQDAVILASDTRATQGPVIADKNCNKTTQLCDYICTGGAGVAGDLFHMNKWMKTQIQLHELNTKTRMRVPALLTILSHELFKYQGHIGCAIIMGGYDTIIGPSLYVTSPDGSCRREMFTSMGSGSLNAYATLEAGYKEGLTIDEGVNLASEAITSGILNDLMSGSNVDISIITKDSTKLIRSYITPSQKFFRQPAGLTFKSGTTKVIRERIQNLTTNETEENVIMG